MYAYVTCLPDIGYVITTMSKFSSTPSALHYASATSRILHNIYKQTSTTREFTAKDRNFDMIFLTANLKAILLFEGTYQVF